VKLLLSGLAPFLHTMKQRWIIGIGLVLVSLGVAMGWGAFVSYREGQHNTALAAKPAVHYQVSQVVNKPVQIISGQPVHLSIPSQGISLDVINGYYNPKTQTWSLSTDKAQYATITALPNNKSGNTFIYGHNRWEVFYHLPRVQLGDEAIITTTNNHTFTYKLSSVKTTNPNDVSLFSYQGPPVLTLQTCTGLWYQNRALFTFQLVGVS
jgi:LPXTG-site transpeptidase (sortase) family protein